MFWYSLFRMLRVSKGNVDDFCNDLHCTHECLNADRPLLKRNRPIGYHELQVSWPHKRVTEPPENIYKGLYQWLRVSHAFNMPKRKAISSDLKNIVINVSIFLKEKKRGNLNTCLEKPRERTAAALSVRLSTVDRVHKEVRDTGIYEYICTQNT